MSLQGFLDCRVTTYLRRTTGAVLQLLQVEFNALSNATQGAGLLHITNLNGSPLHSTYISDSTKPDSDEHLIGADVLSWSTALIAMDEAVTPEPARKKAKLSTPNVCHICANDITSPYSTPCLKCKTAWCLECVKKWFITATKNNEMMPARCCNTLMHHGVAGGILSTAEYEAYKLRYHERTTTNPLYCPVPICSTFIPPHLVEPGQETVNCTICTTRICTKCKQIADTDHVCKEDPAAAQIKALKYKTCPKCNTGLTKMWGCARVLCSCGAHLCFECMRQYNVCERDPCVWAPEFLEYEDEEVGAALDDDEDAQGISTNPEPTSADRIAARTTAELSQPESTGGRHGLVEINALRGSRRRATSDPLASRLLRDIYSSEYPLGYRSLQLPSSHDAAFITAQAFPGSSNTDVHQSDFSARSNPTMLSETPPSAPPSTNLDDPNLTNWEHEPYDFGGEPSENPFDLWGCNCNFTGLKEADVGQHWMDRKHLDCLQCFRLLHLRSNSQATVRAEEWEGFPAWHCGKCGNVVCGDCLLAKMITSGKRMGAP